MQQVTRTFSAMGHGEAERFVLKTWVGKYLIDLMSSNVEAISVFMNTVPQFEDFKSVP